MHVYACVWVCMQLSACECMKDDIIRVLLVSLFTTK